ncbi:hypothetical protein B0T14DRAFT_341604 [Immersiella caudata]|uniref:Fungal N-terminal domain-containing protein n=1 Tax=Immersiella caudata TaxID=314043 RepID=A0AA39WC97_9PEZI|nr:hypothetical protein B0T14DRAFT_341604 [Immersiella caudata]
MADPLSIAASIVGLLATSGKICSVLSSFISGVIDAPQSARDVLAAVEEMRGVLEIVQGLLETLSTLPSRRKSLVRFDLVTITFSGCILTLSELESIVCFKNGLMRRFRWVWEEKRIMRLLPRLESQKASLSLMVTTLVCQSNIVAMESRDKLLDAVRSVVQRDSKLAARIHQIDDLQPTDDHSTQFYDNDSSLTDLTTPRLAGFPNASEISLGPASLRSPTSSQQCTSLLREFETILKTSRVYTRVRSSKTDLSFTSSAVRSHAWSHLSLNDISIVAVFRLPLTLDDINQFGSGLTFSPLLENQHGASAPGDQKTFLGEKPDGSSTPWPSAPLHWALSSKAMRSPKPPGSPHPDTSGSDDEDALLSPHQRIARSTIKLVIVGDRETMKAETLLLYTTNFVYTSAVSDYDQRRYVSIGGDLHALTAFATSSGVESSARRERISTYTGTDIFLVFVRIGKLTTYRNVERLWAPEIRENCPDTPFLVVGIECPKDKLSASEGLTDANFRDYTSLGHSIAARFGAVGYVKCNSWIQRGLEHAFDKAFAAVLSHRQAGND